MPQDIEIQDLKRMMAELIASQKETDMKFKETGLKFQKTDATFQETDERIKQAFDLFESEWSKLKESLVEGDLVNILRARGIDVAGTTMRRKGRRGGHNYEFDIIAHDTTQIVIVEVKTTLHAKHVAQFLEKLSFAKTWMKEYENYQVIGAVAFLLAEEAADVMAENKGLFVIRATGDSAAIINQADFVPKFF